MAVVIIMTVMLGDATPAITTYNNNRNIYCALEEVTGLVLNISHRVIYIFTIQPSNSHSISTSTLQVRKLRHREVKSLA